MPSESLDLDQDNLVLEIKWKGVGHKLSGPSVGACQRLQERIESEKGKEIDVIVGFLGTCGLAKEVALDMPIDKLKLVLEKLTGVVKKS